MMLLNDSRREARFRDGELVLLDDQDRSQWNAEQIAAGRAEVDRAFELGGRGPYVLQATSPRCTPRGRATGRKLLCSMPSSLT
jgi:predicted RNA polymerase sigma factor